MPNIEIHGFPSGSQQASDFVTDIWEALKGIKDFKEIVTTCVDSQVENYLGQKAPFLRLCYTTETTPEELQEIMQRLDAVDLDLEVQELKSFREKKSARDAAIQALMNVRPTGGTDKDFDYGQGAAGPERPPIASSGRN